MNNKDEIKGFDAASRVVAAGKYLWLAGEKFYLKGVSYGPFAPNQQGESLPEPCRLKEDFAHIRELGGNTIRVYFPPPEWLLDEAMKSGLRVFIDVPWDKHRCFFEDWDAMARAREQVRSTAYNLGKHPGVIAISVANEFPANIVRFQGRRRVARFVSELIEIAKSEAPNCLTTFVNFPTTEFLEVDHCDFCCFNVYLHDEVAFGKYIDRLQLIAGDKPLILGEYGIDSQRAGEAEQAVMLGQHLMHGFSKGLAGSVIFSYTDDWFTGGHQIDDWFFGLTHVDRSEKIAARRVSEIWGKMPVKSLLSHDFPKVSVIICTYNGSATLRECLKALTEVNYPAFEIILVDDGSTEDIASIAADFPEVIYERLAHGGLSTARNAGLEMASGEIVAYTDDDCMVDKDWLYYMIKSLQSSKGEAIGGPNITPLTDSWVAKCVALSPGNPTHVMLDDQCAEHVPGCNMAFRRDTLLAVGGFDPQFWVAGDDVDICWRLLDENVSIGYAPGAMVWHHRRETIRAYKKQQSWYGRSEVMLHFKHPRRFGTFGHSKWRGIIYGNGLGMIKSQDCIYHGRFGNALFQSIYRQNYYGIQSLVLSLEWHCTAIFLLLLSVFYWPLVIISLLMETLTVSAAVSIAFRLPLSRDAPWWCRGLLGYLHVMQPIWRGSSRLIAWAVKKHLPNNLQSLFGDAPRLNQSQENSRHLAAKDDGEISKKNSSRLTAAQRSMHWTSEKGIGREQLLEQIFQIAKKIGWSGDFDNGWANWDAKLSGDWWHDIVICTATEELGWPERFTRAKYQLVPTKFNWLLSGCLLVWTLTAVITGHHWATCGGLASLCFYLFSAFISSRKCFRETEKILILSGVEATLEPYEIVAKN